MRVTGIGDVVTQSESEPGTAPLHRFSLDEYHRLILADAFDEDAHIELIDGLLVDMSSKSPEHENVITWLTRWLITSLPSVQYGVRVHSPLTLEDSEPEPDISVIAKDAPRPFHPATASLVIEVAVSSLPRDLGRKVSLYARAGVAEYWVVDLDGARLVVHRVPRPGTSEYGETQELSPNDTVLVRALGLPPLSVGDLLGSIIRHTRSG